MLNSFQSVRLSQNIIADASKYAALEMRSVPKQIEYFYTLGKIAAENPDLPLAFIRDAISARAEIDNKKTSKFNFRTA
ncbi:MAG: ParD-like family protein [Rickettsiales bacterium]|jgi:hypothetical protein|nr:ParD-like family protein [Rickettsiales bacterium]